MLFSLRLPVLDAEDNPNSLLKMVKGPQHMSDLTSSFPSHHWLSISCTCNQLVLPPAISTDFLHHASFGIDDALSIYPLYWLDS